MVAAATDDFSLANKLGQGGFGPVYKVNFAILMDYFVSFRKQMAMFWNKVNVFQIFREGYLVVKKLL